MIHEAVMAEIRGFMNSRIILTAAELGIFTLLDERASTVEEIAGHLKTDRRVTERILECLVTFGLLAKEGAAYSVAGEGVFLSSRNPETILPMVLHMCRLWKNWSVLSEIARKGTESQEIQGLKFDDKDWKAFIGAMHVAARGLSIEIAEACDLGRFRKMLDVGGASGTYTIAFLRRNPDMSAVIFDLQDVIPTARERILAEGLSARVELVAGDFYEDELPGGCDLALLSAIIHQNGLDGNLRLFQKVFRALERGGVVLIRDHVMDESRTKPAAGALFAINMIVNTREGDTYTFGEIRGVLEKAGFVDIKLTRQGEKMDCLVEARKP